MEEISPPLEVSLYSKWLQNDRGNFTGRRIRKTTNYKEYANGIKMYLGESDAARLIIDSPTKVEYLRFVEDSAYDAYVVDENAEIGKHYVQVGDYNTWIRVYDDRGLQAEFRANTIKVYRAGDYGCIIQLIGSDKKAFRYYISDGDITKDEWSYWKS